MKIHLSVARLELVGLLSMTCHAGANWWMSFQEVNEGDLRGAYRYGS